MTIKTLTHDPIDRCSESAAKQLARDLTDSWKARGHDVTFWAIPQGSNRRKSVWGVRSNLVNGIPA